MHSTQATRDKAPLVLNHIERIMWSFVSPRALASRIGCDLDAVSTQLHAAPASRPLLACVVKVQDTLITLSDTATIHIGEQRRRAVRQRRKQVFGLARFEPQLHRGRTSSRLQPGTHRMVRHQVI